MDQLAPIGCVVVLVTVYCSEVNGKGSITFNVVNFGNFIAPENGVLTVVENSRVTPPRLSVDVECVFDGLQSDYSPRSTSDTSSLWSRDGSEIMNTNGAGNTLSVTTTANPSDGRRARTSSALVFPPNITLDLAGNYTCTVTSHTIYFVLHVAVVARIDNVFQDINVTPGTATTLPCQSSGTVPVIKVWYKDGVVLQNTTTTTISENSTLQLSGERSDSATYTCAVKNQFGNQSSTVRFTVQERPYFTASVSIILKAIGRNWLQVTLPPPNTGNSPIMSYTAICRPQAPHYTGLADINMTDSNSRFTITGLQPGATYNCAYFATNRFGSGNESRSVSVSLLPEDAALEPKATSLISGVIGLAIGCVSTILVALVWIEAPKRWRQRHQLTPRAEVSHSHGALETMVSSSECLAHRQHGEIAQGRDRPLPTKNVCSGDDASMRRNN